MLLQSICPALCQSKAHRNTCSNCVHLQVMLTGHCTAVFSLDGQVVGQKLVLPLLALAGTELYKPTDRQTLPAPQAVVCSLPRACTGGSGTISCHSSCWDKCTVARDSGVELEVCQIFSAAGQWLLASPHKGLAEVRAARLILQPGCETVQELSSGVMME